MDQFTVKYKAVMNSEPILKDYSELLKNYIGDVNSVKSNLRGKISGYNQIGKKLGTLSDDLETCTNVMSVMGDKAYSIGQRYQTAERNIQGFNDSQESQSSISEFWTDLIGAVGPTGQIISSLASIYSNVTDGDVNWFNAIEDVFNIADKGHDIFEKATDLGTADWIDYIFGLNVSDKAGKNFFEVFGDELSTTVVDGSKQGLPKWLGTATFLASAAGTAWDNYQDYKAGEMDAERAILETGGEILADVMLDAAITAGVAALLPVGTMAVTVGAAAVVVTWGLDMVCESLTGKSLTEATSDFILDTGQWIGSKAVEAGNALCNWWNDLW